MRKRLKNLYNKLKISYLGEKTKLVPERYWSQFVCIGSASDWHYRWSQIVPPEKKKVLIVGVHGGRDYFYFKAAGFDVRGQDLFPDPDFGEVIIGNIEDVELPEKSFDVIVASAIIEHVANDYLALKNIRKALKDDGLFLIDFPLYNDWEVTHMHIYNEEIMKRLLRSAGFSIQESFAHPNLFFYPPLFNFLNHILNAFTYTLFGKTVYSYTLPPFWKLEFFLSRQQSLLFRATRSFLGKFFNGVQILFVCKKDKPFDHLNFNQERFDTTKN